MRQVVCRKVSISAVETVPYLDVYGTDKLLKLPNQAVYGTDKLLKLPHQAVNGTDKF